MEERGRFLYGRFVAGLPYESTPCQDKLFHTLADFFTSDDGDILVVNGYAGTGKTSAMASVINVMSALKVPCVLLAPTGRSAKVLSALVRLS